MKTIRYSLVKLLGIELLVMAMVFWPLTAEFSNGLVYTALLFKPGFSIFRIVAEIIGAIMFLYLLPLLLRAIRGVPMVTFGDGWFELNLIRTRRIDTMTIQSVERQKWGNALVSLNEGAPAVVPLFLSPNSNDAFQALQSILPGRL